MPCYTAQHHGESQTPIPFLEDARRNLTLLRRTYGRHSSRYRHLVYQYRVVSDELGCRQALERVLHPLRRRSAGRKSAPWRHRPGPLSKF
jgi:hypothetical protein